MCVSVFFSVYMYVSGPKCSMAHAYNKIICKDWDGNQTQVVRFRVKCHDYLSHITEPIIMLQYQ